MKHAFRRHWPEYLIEAALLGLFMISACGFAVLIFHPASPVSASISNPLLQRFLMGLAMGVTAIALIYSPFGKQSGAHFNPAVTLTFFRLGKIAKWDAAFYVIAQFVGGLTGVYVAIAVLGRAVVHPAVNYVVTAPGPYGVAAAFVAEAAMTFVLMSMILRVSNTQNLARFTGLFSGMLVATYITLENPLSGMSMNPARSFASALPAHYWMAIWVYFIAPPLGMLAAAEIFKRSHGERTPGCAKLHHHNEKRCIFCEFHLPNLVIVEESAPTVQIDLKKDLATGN